MIPKQIIILGGGPSLKEGIALGLNEKLQDKCVVACNYAFKHFPHTFMTFIDRDFYYPKVNNENPIASNPNIYSELEQEKLIIGVNHNGVEEFKLNNTILLRKGANYKREKQVKEGWFTGSLTGIFTLNIVSYLMDYSGIVFLCGFDWSRRVPTPELRSRYDSRDITQPCHYYDNIEHRGTGFYGYYENHKPEQSFDHFREKNLKIYNVSMNSNITSFERITYDEMFKCLYDVKVDQDAVRQEVRRKLSV